MTHPKNETTHTIAFSTLRTCFTLQQYYNAYTLAFNPCYTNLNYYLNSLRHTISYSSQTPSLKLYILTLKLYIRIIISSI